MNDANLMLGKVIQGLSGNGSISVVFKAVREEDNQIFAVKYVSSITFQGQKKNKYQQNELDISKKIKEIQSKNLIEIYEIIQLDSEESFIVMEYCDKCDLYGFSLIFWINWQTAIEFGYQIACGINDLHRFNIAHRDLKPENIFVSSQKNQEAHKIEYNIKIGDFGLSKEGDLYQSTVGTPNYMCPESYQQGDKTKETDIWAFGAILFELIEKKQYFSSSSEKNIYNQIKNFKAYDKQKLTQIENDEILEKVNNLIDKCLMLEPKKRIQSAELVKEIQQILLTIQNIPQDKRHISLRVPTNEYLQKQNFYQSVYYEIQDDEVIHKTEKCNYENKLKKQIFKKVESELVENSPDNVIESKNNYQSTDQINESKKEQTNNSIFYEESKLISLNNSKINIDTNNNIDNVQFVLSKMLSNNSNQIMSEEFNQDQLPGIDYSISNFIHPNNNENLKGQDDDLKEMNSSQNILKNKQDALFIQQSNIFSNQIDPIQEVRNSTFQSNQSESIIMSQYFMQSEILQDAQNDQTQDTQKQINNCDIYEITQKNESNQNIQIPRSSQNIEQIVQDLNGIQLNLDNNQQQSLQIQEQQQSQNQKIEKVVDQDYQAFVNMAIKIFQAEDTINFDDKNLIYTFDGKENIILSGTEDTEDINIYVMFYLLMISIGYQQNNFFRQLQKNGIFNKSSYFEEKNSINNRQYQHELYKKLIQQFKILFYSTKYINLKDELLNYRTIEKFAQQQQQQNIIPRPQDDIIFYQKKTRKSIRFILYDEITK